MHTPQDRLDAPSRPNAGFLLLGAAVR